MEDHQTNKMSISTILIATDSFKGSLDAKNVAKAIASGIKQAAPQIKIFEQPLADGGEGTVDCLTNAINGSFHKEIVLGPVGKPVTAKYGISPDKKTAILEMSAAAGMSLVPKSKRDPLQTTTYGVGELIRKVIENGITKIFLGLGGSSTVDAGTGAMMALGANLLDDKDHNIRLGGAFLSRIKKIQLADARRKLENIKLLLLCDVKNPLLGKNGAAQVYAPQKGANQKGVSTLEKGLEHFVKLVKMNFAIDLDIAGNGAAGGIGAGLSLLFQTEYLSGSKFIMEKTELSEKIDQADLVITGEGELNKQTTFGKIPYEVAKIARQKGKRIIGIFGKKSESFAEEKIFDEIITLVKKPEDFDEAYNNPSQILKNRTIEIFRRLF